MQTAQKPGVVLKSELRSESHRHPDGFFQIPTAFVKAQRDAGALFK